MGDSGKATTNDSDSTPDLTFTFDRQGRRASSLANGITTTFHHSESGHWLSKAYSVAGVTITLA